MNHLNQLNDKHTNIDKHEIPNTEIGGSTSHLHSNNLVAQDVDTAANERSIHDVDPTNTNVSNLPLLSVVTTNISDDSTPNALSQSTAPTSDFQIKKQSLLHKDHPQPAHTNVQQQNHNNNQPQNKLNDKHTNFDEHKIQDTEIIECNPNLHQNDSVSPSLDSENAMNDISQNNNDVDANKHGKIEQRDSESEEDQKREEDNQFTAGNLDSEEIKDEANDIQDNTGQQIITTVTNAESSLIKSHTENDGEQIYTTNNRKANAEIIVSNNLHANSNVNNVLQIEKEGAQSDIAERFILTQCQNLQQRTDIDMSDKEMLDDIMNDCNDTETIQSSFLDDEESEGLLLNVSEELNSPKAHDDTNSLEGMQDILTDVQKLNIDETNLEDDVVEQKLDQEVNPDRSTNEMKDDETDETPTTVHVSKTKKRQRRRRKKGAN